MRLHVDGCAFLTGMPPKQRMFRENNAFFCFLDNLFRIFVFRAETPSERQICTMLCISKYRSPLGDMTLAADEKGLTGLWFDGQKYFPDAIAQQCVRQKLPVFEQTCEWLACYFSGQRPHFTPPLHLQGSAFRSAVWELLREIPYGRTLTYGQIAAEIARRRQAGTFSAQAVGGAVAHNPVSIIVPCHRVVGSNGSLTGYAGGIERKIALLQLERTDISRLFVPGESPAR